MQVVQGTASQKPSISRVGHRHVKQRPLSLSSGLVLTSYVCCCLCLPFAGAGTGRHAGVGGISNGVVPGCQETVESERRAPYVLPVSGLLAHNILADQPFAQSHTCNLI